MAELRGETRQAKRPYRCAAAAVPRGQHPDHVRVCGPGAGRGQAGMSEFLIITGVSGAGRSQAADTFEDLGWFVIDNLPPALIGKVAELVQVPGATTERVALVVGTGHYLDEVTAALDQLRATAARVRVLFLEASDEVLVRRFENTRRRHPMAESDRVSDGIGRERALLDPVKSQADVVVDTSDLNVHQLRDRLLELFGNDVRGPDADQRRVVRLQARPPARRRPRLRLPLPAQSPLGGGPPSPHRARSRRCRSTSPASPRPRSSWPSSTTCSACCCRRTSRRASPTCRSRSAARAAPTGRCTSPRSWPSC